MVTKHTQRLNIVYYININLLNHVLGREFLIAWNSGEQDLLLELATRLGRCKFKIIIKKLNIKFI